ncbi:MAG: metallophosphoesterase, partial [Bacteroidota bacterium]|nr:metallophosphoesterase [Bacteroidota bacterium]
PELIEGDFHFTHHRDDRVENNLFTFCGHIHPIYCVRSIGRQSIKLPGFIHDQHRMILPSFGVFTGGYEMEPIPGRQVYVVVENKVLKV